MFKLNDMILNTKNVVRMRVEIWLCLYILEDIYSHLLQYHWELVASHACNVRLSLVCWSRNGYICWRIVPVLWNCIYSANNRGPSSESGCWNRMWSLNFQEEAEMADDVATSLLNHLPSVK